MGVSLYLDPVYSPQCHLPRISTPWYFSKQGCTQSSTLHLAHIHLLSPHPLSMSCVWTDTAYLAAFFSSLRIEAVMGNIFHQVKVVGLDMTVVLFLLIVLLCGIFGSFLWSEWDENMPMKYSWLFPHYNLWIQENNVKEMQKQFPVAFQPFSNTFILRSLSSYQTCPLLPWFYCILQCSMVSFSGVMFVCPSSLWASVHSFVLQSHVVEQCLLFCLCRLLQLHNHILQKVSFQSDSFWKVSRPFKRTRHPWTGIFKRAEYITEVFPKILNCWIKFICHLLVVAHYHKLQQTQQKQVPVPTH